MIPTIGDIESYLLIAAFLFPCLAYALVLRYGDSEARGICIAPALLYWGVVLFILIAGSASVLYAQSPEGIVPWPEDPWCEIYWWLGWPLCWF